MSNDENGQGTIGLQECIAGLQSSRNQTHHCRDNSLRRHQIVGESDVPTHIAMRANDMQQAIYISDIAVAERYQVSRATIWRWTQFKRFPDPVKLSAGCTRWSLSDIEIWEKQQRQQCPGKADCVP